MGNFQLKAAIALVAASALSSTFVSAAEAPKPYVTTKTGKVVTDHRGHCVRTSVWSEAIATKECDPHLFPDEPAPVVAAVVYESTTVSANALFGFDQADLKPEGKEALQALRDKIQAQGAKVVDIDVVGHTDSMGAEDYNQGLSERRANAVKDYIVSEKGVDASIIDVSGKGESAPVADNATAEGRAQNRRVEVHVGVSTPQ